MTDTTTGGPKYFLTEIPDPATPGKIIGYAISERIAYVALADRGTDPAKLAMIAAMETAMTVARSGHTMMNSCGFAGENGNTIRAKLISMLISNPPDDN